jgi:DNA-binding response OmpR family regulator
MSPTPSPARIAVLDSDSGFVQVLTKRLEAADWQYRVLASPVPLDVLISMRLNALVVDPAVLGPAAWSYLEKLCARLPQLGVVVCTGQSTVAQRVRGLRLGADDWVTKPCHPEEVIARAAGAPRRARTPSRSWPASWRSGATSSRPSPPAATRTSRAASSS